MTRKIQGTVAVTSADNLASQLLGGYMQLGSATRRCRHCMAHRVDMGTKVCLHNNMVKVLPCSVTRLIILTLLTNIGSFFWKLTCWCTVVYVSSCFSQGQVNTIPKYSWGVGCIYIYFFFFSSALLASSHEHELHMPVTSPTWPCHHLPAVLQQHMVWPTTPSLIALHGFTPLRVYHQI